MGRWQSLDKFIVCLAKRIAAIYSSNCANEEDYIQIGHLTLATIRGKKQKHRNLKAYAIIAIANTMRNAALDAMYTISAPRRIKKKVHQLEILLAEGKTEQEICQELNITSEKLANLRRLIFTEPWHMLFQEPTYESEPFFVFDDLLLCDDLTSEDKEFLQAQFDENLEHLELSRNQRYSRIKNLRPKLMRSDYGV
jgi:DNA-directed RNA polymerase specialized sigma subunit